MKKVKSLILGRRSNKIRKDQLYRINYQIYEIIKKLNPWIYKNQKSLIKNKCILTGRSRSTHRLFRLSRIMIKEYGDSLHIPGLRKNG